MQLLSTLLQADDSPVYVHPHLQLSWITMFDISKTKNDLKNKHIAIILKADQPFNVVSVDWYFVNQAVI